MRRVGIGVMRREMRSDFSILSEDSNQCRSLYVLTGAKMRMRAGFFLLHPAQSAKSFKLLRSRPEIERDNFCGGGFWFSAAAFSAPFVSFWKFQDYAFIFFAYSNAFWSSQHICLFLNGVCNFYNIPSVRISISSLRYMASSAVFMPCAQCR